MWGTEQFEEQKEGRQAYLSIKDLLVDFPSGNLGRLPHRGHLGRWLDRPCRKAHVQESRWGWLSLRPEVERQSLHPSQGQVLSRGRDPTDGAGPHRWGGTPQMGLSGRKQGPLSSLSVSKPKEGREQRSKKTNLRQELDSQRSLAPQSQDPNP